MQIFWGWVVCKHMWQKQKPSHVVCYLLHSKPIKHGQHYIGLVWGTDWVQERYVLLHDNSTSSWWLKGFHYYTLNNSCKLKITIQAYRYIYLELQASIFHVIRPTDTELSELRWFFVFVYTYLYTPFPVYFQCLFEKKILIYHY